MSPLVSPVAPATVLPLTRDRRACPRCGKRDCQVRNLEASVARLENPGPILVPDLAAWIAEGLATLTPRLRDARILCGMVRDGQLRRRQMRTEGRTSPMGRPRRARR
jgi:hypothetical protein